MPKLTGEALDKARARMAHARANRKPAEEKPLKEEMGSKASTTPILATEVVQESAPMPERDTKNKEDAIEAVLRMVETGSELTKACESHGITRDQVYAWKERSTETESRFLRARRLQAAWIADLILRACKRLVGEMPEDKVAPQDVAALRVGVEQLARLAGKLDASAWGDYVGAPRSQTLQIGSVGELHLNALQRAPGQEVRALPAKVSDEGQVGE